MARISKFTEMTVSQLERVRANFLKRAHIIYAPNHFDVAVSALATQKRLGVVQVGANDAKSNDPLYNLAHRHAFHIMLIEPIPHMIPLIREDYFSFSGSVIVENVTVSDSPKNFELYCLQKEYCDKSIAAVGRHPTEISTTDISMLLRQLAPRLGLSGEDLKLAIDGDDVETRRLEELLDKHGFEEDEVLQIDC